MTRVIIKPLPIKRWHGKEGKEDFRRPVKIRALVDPKTGRYATGLTEEDIKMLREKYGIDWDLSDIYDFENPHPFWDTKKATLVLDNQTMILDTSNPMDYIKWKLAKASKFVANSIDEWEAGLYPDATHYIYDEEEEIKKKSKRVEVKKRAIMKWVKLSRNKKVKVITIILKKPAKEFSDEQLEVEFFEALEKSADRVLDILEMDSKDLNSVALVVEAISNGLIKRKSSKYYYGDIYLGMTYKDIVKFLNDDNNQDIRIDIMSKLG